MDEEPLQSKELKELAELATQWTQLREYVDVVTFPPVPHLEREPVISRFGQLFTEDVKQEGTE